VLLGSAWVAVNILVSCCLGNECAATAAAAAAAAAAPLMQMTRQKLVQLPLMSRRYSR
jgi:hypothetical protein